MSALMSQMWTGLRHGLPRLFLRPFRMAWLAAGILGCALAFWACRGDDDGNRILPVRADITIDPVSDDPAVYFERVSASGDLVTVNVRLRTMTRLQFESFNLEIHLVDPATGEIQPGIMRSIAALYQDTLLCACDASDTTCSSSVEPLCERNEDEVLITGKFLFGAAAKSGSPLFEVTGDEKLLTLGFLAATTTPGTRIKMISSPQPNGDCEILNGLIDVGVPCRDGNATLTATR